MSSKHAFTLTEIAVVMVIISVMMSSVMISRQLILSAKANKVQQDFTDLQKLITIFRNTFDCLPGDCAIERLPASITNFTPPACFNLQTDYKTALGTNIITSFNTEEIDSNAKRTCAFYEMQALEPQAFGAAEPPKFASLYNVFKIQSARAIGKGAVYLYTGSTPNPKLGANPNQSQITAKNNIKANNNNLITNTYNPVLTNCDKYKNSVSVQSYHATTQSPNAGTFFATNSVGNTSAQTSTGTYNMRFNFNVATEGTYYMQVGGSDTVTFDINGGTQSSSTILSTTPPSQTVTLQAGINSISTNITNAVGVGGVAIVIKDAAGNQVWSTINSTSSTVAGLGAFTGCPDSCGTGTNCYCNSTCKTSITSMGGSTSVASGYNQAKTKIAELTNDNANLDKEIAMLNDTAAYIMLSVETATNPSVSGLENVAMWDLRTNNHKSMLSTGFYPLELTTNASHVLFSNWNTKMTVIGRTTKQDSITETANTSMSGFTTRMSALIDRKYDDGLPYSGNIIAGKNSSQKDDKDACTTAVSADFSNLASAITNSTYASGNTVDKGCTLAWKVMV